MKNIKGVLFDYDGVIARPDDNIKAWKTACLKYNFTMTNEDWYEWEGLKPEELAEKILKKYKIKNLTAKMLSNEKKSQYDIISNESGYKVQLYENLIQILSYLKEKGIKCGLVTGAIRSRVIKSTPDLLNYFDTIVAADDEVDGEKIEGKPAPDPWLLAAKNIDLSPENCIVVENAVLGVKSAKLAKMFCIALLTTIEKESLVNAGADLVLKNHLDLTNYFQNSYE